MTYTAMKHIILLTSALSLVACAGGVKKKAPSTIKYTKMIVPQNVKIDKLSKSSKCPTSSKVWKSETWKKVMKMANSCVQKKNWKMVDRLGNHLSIKENHSPWGPYYLSLAAEAKKNYSRAMWMIDLSLKKAPKIGLLHYQKGRIYWSLNEYNSSVTYFQKALKYDSTIIDAEIFLGQVYLMSHNYKKAMDHFEEVLEKKPNHKNSLVGMAECYESQRKYKKALSLLNRSISVYPSQLNFRLRAAYIYENFLKSYHEALAEYKKIRTLKSQNRIPGRIGFNLNDKIKSLESMVNKTLPGSKLSQRKPAKKQK